MLFIFIGSEIRRSDSLELFKKRKTKEKHGKQLERVEK